MKKTDISPQSGSLLQVMSYNILYHHDTRWGEGYRWPPRAHSVCGLVRRLSPDLIGFQEVTQIQFDDLRAALEGYGAVEGPPALEDIPDDSLYPWFFNAVFYRMQRLQPLQAGWRPLETNPDETPEPDGSFSSDALRQWQSRHAIWTIFHDLKTDMEFLHINTHWPTQARFHPQCAGTLEGIIDEFGGRQPCIVTGDFNRPGNPLPGTGLLDAWQHCGRTSSGISGSKIDRATHRLIPGSTIDHIMLSEEFRVESLTAIDERKTEDGRPPSDHLPIMACVEQQKRAG